MGVILDKLGLDTGDVGIDNGSGSRRLLLMRTSVRKRTWQDFVYENLLPGLVVGKGRGHR